MMDDLTRAVAEALGCTEALFMPWAAGGGSRAYIKQSEGSPTCGTHTARQGWPCPEAERIADALAPLIEARVREARAALSAAPEDPGLVQPWLDEDAARADLDPAALLAALVQAGVLEETFTYWPTRRRYVTRWEDVDE